MEAATRGYFITAATINMLASMLTVYMMVELYKKHKEYKQQSTPTDSNTQTQLRILTLVCFFVSNVFHLGELLIHGIDNNHPEPGQDLNILIFDPTTVWGRVRVACAAVYLAGMWLALAGQSFTTLNRFMRLEMILPGYRAYKVIKCYQYTLGLCVVYIITIGWATSLTQSIGGVNYFKHHFPYILSWILVILQPILLLTIIILELCLNGRLITTTLGHYVSQGTSWDHIRIVQGFTSRVWNRLRLQSTLKRTLVGYLYLIIAFDIINLTFFILGLWFILAQMETITIAASLLSVHIYLNFKLLDLFVLHLRQSTQKSSQQPSHTRENTSASPSSKMKSVMRWPRLFSLQQASIFKSVPMSTLPGSVISDIPNTTQLEATVDHSIHNSSVGV